MAEPRSGSHREGKGIVKHVSMTIALAMLAGLCAAQDYEVDEQGRVMVRQLDVHTNQPTSQIHLHAGQTNVLGRRYPMATVFTARLHRVYPSAVRIAQPSPIIRTAAFHRAVTGPRLLRAQPIIRTGIVARPIAAQPMPMLQTAQFHRVPGPVLQPGQAPTLRTLEPVEVQPTHRVVRFKTGYDYTSLEEALKNPEEVHGLSLSDQELTDIPREVFTLANLEVLRLEYNRITVVPRDIAKLQNLRTFDVRGNLISDVPDELFTLHKLQHLNLSENRLTRLSYQIGKLTGLRSLVLGGNPLTRIPDEVYGLEELRQLTLSRCGLTALSFRIGQLRRLRRLDADGNQFQSIPSQIGALPDLRGLGLADNLLTALPNEIGDLANLRWLGLDNNRLTQLPFTIGNLKSLRKLDLTGNEIPSWLMDQIAASLPDCEIQY